LTAAEEQNAIEIKTMSFICLVLLLIVDTIKYNLRSLQRKQLTAILGKIAYESKYSA